MQTATTTTTLVLVLFFIVCLATAQRLGGYQEINTVECRDAAEFAMIHIQARSNSMYKMHLFKIDRCEQQLVAGLNYRMRLHVGGQHENANLHFVNVVVHEKLEREENGAPIYELLSLEQ